MRSTRSRDRPGIKFFGSNHVREVTELAACKTLGIPSAVQSRHTQCERERNLLRLQGAVPSCDRGA